VDSSKVPPLKKGQVLDGFENKEGWHVDGKMRAFKNTDYVICSSASIESKK
jgi:hypothetical protein